jgi:hypothetical protein
MSYDVGAVRLQLATAVDGSGRASRGGGVFGQGRIFGILILPALRFKSAKSESSPWHESNFRDATTTMLW